MILKLLIKNVCSIKSHIIRVLIILYEIIVPLELFNSYTYYYIKIKFKFNFKPTTKLKTIQF